MKKKISFYPGKIVSPIRMLQKFLLIQNLPILIIVTLPRLIIWVSKLNQEQWGMIPQICNWSHWYATSVPLQLSNETLPPPTQPQLSNETMPLPTQPQLSNKTLPLPTTATTNSYVKITSELIVWLCGLLAGHRHAQAYTWHAMGTVEACHHYATLMPRRAILVLLLRLCTPPLCLGPPLFAPADRALGVPMACHSLLLNYYCLLL